MTIQQEHEKYTKAFIKKHNGKPVPKEIVKAYNEAMTKAAEDYIRNRRPPDLTILNTPMMSLS